MACHRAAFRVCGRETHTNQCANLRGLGGPSPRRGVRRAARRYARTTQRSDESADVRTRYGGSDDQSRNDRLDGAGHWLLRRGIRG